MRTVKFLLLLLGIAGVTLAIAAAKTASVSVDSKLYSSANLQSSVVATLKQGSSITIDSRKGGWYQVKTESGESGWVRSYDVQIKSNTSWFSRLKRVIAGSSSQQSNASATIGIRGLGPGDVKKAQPNPQELAKLDNFKQTLSDGKKYASSVPLRSNNVAYFENIKTTVSSSSSNKSTSQPESTKTETPKKKDDNDLINKAIDSLW